MNQPAKLKKLPQFVTETLECKWSNLLKPDTAFGEASANHNITVVMDQKLKAKLQDVLKKSGAKKINGIYEKEGVTYLKTKSRLHVEAGKFPCVDANAQETDIVAFGGDKVKLKLAPAIVARDKSLSFYLNGVQIIERNENNNSVGSSGFSAVDGGFTSPKAAAATKPAAVVVEETEDEELPF
jgi:hypothetical protein